jgi:hypothetical protein
MNNMRKALSDFAEKARIIENDIKRSKLHLANVELAETVEDLLAAIRASTYEKEILAVLKATLKQTFLWNIGIKRANLINMGFTKEKTVEELK